MATEREGSSYTTAPWSQPAPAAVARRHLCVSISCLYGLNVECKNPGTGPGTFICIANHTVWGDLCHMWQLSNRQSFIACRTHPPNNHVWRLRLSLAGHTREQQTQSTYKGYIIPTHPQLFLHCPSPIIFSARLQHKSATTASVGAISKSNSL